MWSYLGWGPNLEETAKLAGAEVAAAQPLIKSLAQLSRKTEEDLKKELGAALADTLKKNDIRILKKCIDPWKTEFKGHVDRLHRQNQQLIETVVAPGDLVSTKAAFVKVVSETEKTHDAEPLINFISGLTGAVSIAHGKVIDTPDVKKETVLANTLMHNTLNLLSNEKQKKSPQIPLMNLIKNTNWLIG